MLKLPLLSWVGNAAAVLCGRHGDVAEQARQAACSRQTVYDHAGKVQRAVAAAALPGPDRPRLLQEIEQLRDESRQLWGCLDQSIDCPEDKLRQFAVTATAMGLSLSQALALLAILVPARRRPSRATLGRWALHAARKAGVLLAALDQACRCLVLCLCLDEIFFRRRPVLMAVEPASLAWVLARRTADRCGQTWAKALAAWPEVLDVAADGGSGIERGLELAKAQRQQASQATPTAAPARPIHAQLDVFHLRRDGARALRLEWERAEALWDEAVKIERAKGRFDRRGGDRRRFDKRPVDKAWAKAMALFEEASRKERAWHRAVAALQVFRTDGSLNDRDWARAELSAAAAELTGPAWTKVRRQLADARVLTFVERLHQSLEAAEPCPERRAALVALWRWRRQPRRGPDAGEGGAAATVAELLVWVVQARLGQGWKEAYRRVSRALSQVVRASSAVECVNSVVRMHQARHRNTSQELLDLKRLFWNCRGFVAGKRKGRCPYELLGLKLPSYDPWALLSLSPDQLEQQLSSYELAS
jgi:hypothetical protein